MSKLTDKASYLKGLAAGMKLNMDKDSNKLILEILDVLGEIAEELEKQGNAFDELNDYVERIDDDLTELNDYVESIEDDLVEIQDACLDDDECCDCDDCEDDEDCDCEDCCDDEDDDDEDDDDELISYACPSCGHELQFRASSVDFDEDYRCPSCGKPVFPELDEDEDE